MKVSIRILTIFIRILILVFVCYEISVIYMIYKRIMKHESINWLNDMTCFVLFIILRIHNIYIYIYIYICVYIYILVLMKLCNYFLI